MAVDNQVVLHPKLIIRNPLILDLDIKKKKTIDLTPPCKGITRETLTSTRCFYPKKKRITRGLEVVPQVCCSRGWQCKGIQIRLIIIVDELVLFRIVIAIMPPWFWADMGTVHGQLEPSWKEGILNYLWLRDMIMIKVFNYRTSWFDLYYLLVLELSCVELVLELESFFKSCVACCSYYLN